MTSQRGVPILVAGVLFFVTGTIARAQQPLVSREFEPRLKLLSGHASILAAKSLGIAAIAGKPLNIGSSPGNAQSKKLIDIPIGDHPIDSENQPTIAANPRKKKRLVAGSHYFASGLRDQCVVYTSSDSGATWSAPTPMPLLALGSLCSHPVLVYAPDGERVYCTYMDMKLFGDWDIVVSYSDNDGATWTGPIIVLDAQPGFLYDNPWIGVHTHDDSQTNWVYVTATQFDTDGPPFLDKIDFARSANRSTAGSWSAPVPLDTSVDPNLVQGARPAGGNGGEIVVAWYHSGFDGWLTGGFEIRTRRSDNHGGTFDPVVIASADSFETPFWLGPSASYHQWWTTMFPDIEIDGKGQAHILYTHDPVAGTATPEDGDIRYISSPGPPYIIWSFRTTINDDGSGKAQGFAALSAQKQGHLHAIWEDHRTSPTDNLRFDMFYARKVPGAAGWVGRNVRVTEASSLSDLVFVGDHNDIATNEGFVFGTFTDRRDKVSIFDFEDDVFGSRISPGGAQTHK